jgi:hypothetical protein
MSNDGEEFEFELPAEHGDLVTVDGYDGRLFMVIAYQLIRNFLPEEEYNEIVYEVIDAYTGEFLEADGEDVEFVTDADHAAAYVRENPNPKAFAIDTSHLENKGAERMAKEERKPTAREWSAKEAEERKKARKERAAKIDRLLDELNDYKRLAAQFGDEEYKARVEYVTLKLAELME